MKKTLLVTCYFPPHTAGPALILGMPFRQINQRDFCILTFQAHPNVDPRSDPSTTLECRYYTCSFPEGIRRLSPGLFGANRQKYLLVPYLVLKGIYILLRERIKAILADMEIGGGGFLVSAYLLHLLTRKPLYLYALEQWEEAVGRTRERFIAHLFERRMFRAARRVAVLSPALQDIYRRKYGIEPVILPISLELPPRPTPKPAPQKPYLIAYTGMIYSACLDSLQNLAEVVRSLPPGELKLVIATTRDRDYLERENLLGPNIEHAFRLPREEFLALQRRADILFLPQAFQTPDQEVVNALLPSKTVEYLVSGNPILVHAPASAQIAQYAKDKGFALVVDKKDPGLLKEEILRLLHDQPLRQRLVERAWQTAQENHDARVVARRLQEFIDGVAA